MKRFEISSDLNKLKEAKLLLKQSSENIAVIVGNLWSENFPNQPVPHSLEVQIKEYTAYILYLVGSLVILEDCWNSRLF